MDQQELKLYAVVSPSALKLMGGNRGKLSAQTGHAYLHAWWNSFRYFNAYADKYQDEQAAAKVTLVLPLSTLEEEVVQLLKLIDEHQDICGTTFVKDAARTVFTEPTVTCIGIGPIYPSMCSDFMKSLRPLI